jgi:mannosyltransferase
MAAVVTSTKGGVARRLRNRRRAVVRRSPVPSARPRSGVPQPEIGSNRNRRIAALLAGVFATGLGLLGAGRPTIWYDEAVTLNLLHRPFGETWPVLREVDAVHGIYYMVLRGWTWFTGDSIEAVRAFSALGVGVTAAATVLLVARHQRLLVATAAGFVTGIVPGLAWTALDGRSYAWSAAFAVLATLALENACRHRKRPRDWVLYGVVCLFACCWHLYLVLLIIGHGIAVMVGFPKGRVPWTLTAIGTAVVGVPLGLIAWSQRDQVSWLVDTNYPWEKMLLNQLTSGQSADPDWVRWVFLVGLLVFFVLGIRQLWKKGRRWLPSVLALWAGLPTVVAVVCAAVADGGMHPRYVTFAVPAYAIAATVGAFSLPKWTPAVAGVAGLAVVAPILVSQRAPDAKPDNLRRLAATVEAQDPDAVYFTVPKARSIPAAYPDAFEGIDDLSASADQTPMPFFAGNRDTSMIKLIDVAELRILVFGTRPERSADRLRTLGCRSEPVTSDRHFVVTLYTCPEVNRGVR